MTTINPEEMDKVVESLLADYRNNRTVDKLDAFNLPNRSEIASLTQKLMRLLYPGYFRDKSTKYYNMDHLLSSLIEDIAYRLEKQIDIAMGVDRGEVEGEKKAHDITMSFLESIPRIREYLDTDIIAAYDGDPAAYSYDEIIFSYPGLYAISVYRLAHELYVAGVPMIPRMMTELAHGETGIDIHPGAQIGKYFFIDHGTGIVIGETTIIGEHVKIYQGVTLGGLSTRAGQGLKNVKRHPTIHDNVTIYSGASILGGETVIGEGCMIGSNAFVTKSLPAGSRVSFKDN